MTAKVFAITQFVTVADVQEALQCSRTTAYEHLRRAAGRKAGDRGMLRVAVRTWERYVAQAFSEQARRPGPARARPATTPEVGPIPITRPRTKPKR